MGEKHFKKTSCDNSSKFAIEENEDKIIAEDYANIYFKKECCELFENECMDIKINGCQFYYLVGQAIKCRDNEWISALLQKFHVCLKITKKRKKILVFVDF